MFHECFPLIVRPIVPTEQTKFCELMAAHHYLGWHGVVWERVLYVAERDGKWLALLAWTSGAQKVGVREKWLGWDEALRESRLFLIANNARFLILPEISEKNLASQILALNLKRLSSDWQIFYGHPILLAETFVDPQRFRGTCYRAANWILLGQTRGFGKKSGQWVKHGCKKSLFVYPLIKQARQRLADPQINPISLKPGVYRMNTNKLPLQGKEGLMAVLSKIQDPRSCLGRQHPLVSILAISLCAVLSGARTFEGIADWAKSLTKKQLCKFSVRKKRPPSEPTIRRVLQTIDSQEVDNKFSAWFHKNNSFADKAISLDGKALKGARHPQTKVPLMLLSAVLHQECTVVAQTQVAEKSNEIPAIKDLFSPLDITGTMVTADALHTQVASASYIVKDKKADFLLTVKENQPKLLEKLKSLPDKNLDNKSLGNKGSSPVPHITTTDKAHGRVETRSLTLLELPPSALSFPFVEQAFKIERTRKIIATGKTTSEIVYGITSREKHKASPKQLLAFNRQHWTIENSVHYIRDVSFDEDRSQVRTKNGPRVMASLRNFAISLIKQMSFKTIPQALRKFAYGSKRLVMAALGIV